MNETYEEVKSTEWVVSADPNQFDTINAFKELHTVDWKQVENSKIQVNDIVYIYISHDVHCIKVKTLVKEVGISLENTIRDDKYILDAETLSTSKNYMRLELIKFLEGCAYNSDYMKEFGFSAPQAPKRISSMGQSFVDYLKLIEKLQEMQEIVPAKYDASYEFVSSIIKAYTDLKDFSNCDFNDLNLIYLSTVGTWKHSVEKKKESIDRSHLSNENKDKIKLLLDTLWTKVGQKFYQHSYEGERKAFGMFGTGFYNTETKTTNESVQKIIKLCVELLDTDDESECFDKSEKVLSDGVEGLAAGGLSQILHCLKPYVFPILNSNQNKNNVFQTLGIKLEKTGKEQYYINNCRKIREYRDSNFNWKNYRIFDIQDIKMEDNNEYTNFKCLLEYFVSHLEYIQNDSDNNSIGYEKYLKPLLDGKKFKSEGQGYKGNKIQNQISQWENYESGKIYINISNNYSSYSTRRCYLNWEDTGINVVAKWNKDNHIIGLLLHVYNKDSNGIKHRKDIGTVKSLSTLGLFDDLPPNQELKQFLDDFKNLLVTDQQNVIKEMEAKEMEKLIEQLKTSKNLIFTGAPGTGKTFLAEEIAEKMGAEYKLVQFHPSYDYTDFVEGLRPVEKNGTLGFERKDGEFKSFCAKAIDNLEKSKKTKEEQAKDASTAEIIEDFISDAMDKTLEFEITTGNKFFISSIDEKNIYINIPANDKKKELTLQKTILIDLINAEKQLSTSGEIREFYNRKWRTQEDSYYFTLYTKIYENSKNKKKIEVKQIERKDFVFIIDEINRGEVSKIFGELFYAIDSGYRGRKDKAVQTQYQNLIKEGDVFKDGFYVPENVYIIGTMNDIDRSVESIDFAFRRRFTWKEVTAEDSMSILDKDDAWTGYGAKPSSDVIESLKNRVRNLNKEISQIEGLNSAYHIGASYLLKYGLYDESDAISKLWENHLKGVLYEYLRGRPQIENVLGRLESAFKNDIVETESEDDDEAQED